MLVGKHYIQGCPVIITSGFKNPIYMQLFITMLENSIYFKMSLFICYE